ncbi:MAG: hypothetical protein M3436_03535 [Pseudomonadota bacterium]|nr:hypothetical protein [Pseudomonadota bacterium]
MNRTRAEERAERNLIESLWWALALGLTVILGAQIYNSVSWEIHKEAHGCEVTEYVDESDWTPEASAWSCADGSTHFR